MKTKRREVLEEFRAALNDRMSRPRSIGSHMRLVLARDELERYVMVPWRKHVWREFLAWMRGGVVS